MSTYDEMKSKAFFYLQGPIVGCQEVVAEVAAKNCSRTCCQTLQQLSPSIKYQNYLKIHLRRSHGLSRKSRGQKGVQLEVRSDFFSIISTCSAHLAFGSHPTIGESAFLGSSSIAFPPLIFSLSVRSATLPKMDAFALAVQRQRSVAVRKNILGMAGK